MPSPLSAATHHQQLNSTQSLMPLRVLSQQPSQHRALAIDHSYLQVVDDGTMMHSARPTFYFSSGGQHVLAAHTGGGPAAVFSSASNEQPNYNMSTSIGNRQHNADNSALNSETYYYVLAPQPHGTPVLQPRAAAHQQYRQQQSGQMPSGQHAQQVMLASPAFFSQHPQQQQRQQQNTVRGQKVDPCHEINELFRQQPSTSSSAASHRVRRRRRSAQRSSTSSNRNARNNRNNSHSTGRNEFDEEFDDDNEDADEELERCVKNDAIRRQHQRQQSAQNNKSQQAKDGGCVDSGQNEVRAGSSTSSGA